MSLKSHHHHWKDLLKSFMNDHSFVDDPNKDIDPIFHPFNFQQILLAYFMYQNSVINKTDLE